MENHGSEPATTSSALHGPGYSGKTPFVHANTLPRGAYSDDFHTFAVEWDTAQVRFFVDGALHYRITRDEVARRGPWVFDHPFIVILNLAVGGTFDGDPRSDAVVPATMVIDYVRVFEAAR
jgi:beta-glucanase (GH16 family)